MKLRLRQNSLRFRVNQKEVKELAGGLTLREEIHFPEGSRLVYLLEPFGHGPATASFLEGTIRIAAPGSDIRQWADGEAIGMYFQLSAHGTQLKISIEKDLECLDGPEEERDPLAFARVNQSVC